MIEYNDIYWEFSTKNLFNIYIQIRWGEVFIFVKNWTVIKFTPNGFHEIVLFLHR